MTTIKDRIILGLGRHGGQVEHPYDLVPDTETDTHNTVHVLWRLQKEGFVTFRTRKDKPRTERPIRITLTQAGEQRYKDLIR